MNNVSNDNAVSIESLIESLIPESLKDDITSFLKEMLLFLREFATMTNDAMKTITTEKIVEIERMMNYK